MSELVSNNRRVAKPYAPRKSYAEKAAMFYKPIEFEKLARYFLLCPFSAKNGETCASRRIVSGVAVLQALLFLLFELEAVLTSLLPGYKREDKGGYQSASSQYQKSYCKAAARKRKGGAFIRGVGIVCFVTAICSS